MMSIFGAAIIITIIVITILITSKMREMLVTLPDQIALGSGQLEPKVRAARREKKREKTAKYFFVFIQNCKLRLEMNTSRQEI